MLKTHIKMLFYILLIPSYIQWSIVALLLITSMGQDCSMIMWKEILIGSFLNLVGAWMLSRKNNLGMNLCGILFFVAFAYPLVTYHLNNPRLGPWKLNLYAGIFIIGLGILGFIYTVYKRRK